MADLVLFFKLNQMADMENLELTEMPDPENLVIILNGGHQNHDLNQKEDRKNLEINPKCRHRKLFN